jgi:hypothetical protein
MGGQFGVDAIDRVALGVANFAQVATSIKEGGK